jgi:hypothetical protein
MLTPLCNTSRIPHFLHNPLTMAARSSALRADPWPPGRFLVLIPVRGRVDPRATMRLEGLCHLKTVMISSRTEPATFRLVAWCLNQLRYRVLPYICNPICAVLGAIIQPQSSCSSLSMRTVLGCGTRHCTGCLKKRGLRGYSKCYCVANVTKAFTLRGVQIIHRSTCSAMDILYTFKCTRFRNTRLAATFGIPL